MKKYAVTMRAVVTKTYVIEADCEEHAIDEVNGIFSVLNEENIDESYTQEVMDVEEVNQGESK